MTDKLYLFRIRYQTKLSNFLKLNASMTGNNVKPAYRHRSQNVPSRQTLTTSDPLLPMQIPVMGASQLL